jgi:hypothetical protein
MAWLLEPEVPEDVVGGVTWLRWQAARGWPFAARLSGWADQIEAGADPATVIAEPAQSPTDTPDGMFAMHAELILRGYLDCAAGRREPVPTLTVGSLHG